MASKERSPPSIFIVLVVFITTIVLIQIGRMYPSAWDTIIVFTFGWVIADYAISKFDVRTRGAVKIPHTHYHVPRIAFAYVIYFVAILVATKAGEIGIPILFSLIGLLVQGSVNVYDSYLSMTSFASGVLVFIDLFYLHNDRSIQSPEPAEQN